MFFRLKLFLYILVSFFVHAEIAHVQNEQGSMLKKVVIDPGHGGHEPGAIGYAKSKEKDINLAISLRLGKMINEKYPDVEVIYTRKTDVFVELYKRGEIANKANADLFISIHANSTSGRCPSGTETIVMGYDKESANMEVAKRENAVIILEENYEQHYEGFDPNKPESFILFSLQQNAYQNQSIDFAREIQEQFKSAKRVSRGVKQAGTLVLWRTAMPSVLVEVGFICHPEEEKFMTSTAGKDKLAAAIFQAFCSYKSKIEDRSSFRSDHSISDFPMSDIRSSDHPTSDIRLSDHPTSDAQIGKSEIGKSEIGKSEVGKSEIGKSEIGKSDIGKSEVGKSEIGKSEIGKSEIKKKVEFCVQIATTSKPKNTNPINFKRYKDVERIQVSPTLYKYIVGRTANDATAQETLKKVRADFQDAFVVSIVDGKIIPAAEGRKLITE